MSLLIVQHLPGAVLVCTDTLATTPEGEPYLLVTKCSVVPHLDMVIAGTGVAELTERWRRAAASQILARDIDMLDRYTPEILRPTWAEVLADNDGVPPTATVYHFGWSWEREEYVGYAYRSTRDFESEPLEPGMRVKPEPVGPFNADDGFVELAERIRCEQAELSPEHRIYIGGDLILTALHEQTILTRRLHRFADFEEQWLLMNETIHRHNQAEPLI